MADAMLDVFDNGTSITQAARKRGIPPTTLSARLRTGRSAPSAVLQPTQRLTPQEEDRLVTWILRQDQCGYAPSAKVVRACVVALLELKGDTAPLGKNWMKAFKKRNPKIKSLQGRKQEASRFSGFTLKAVN